MKCKIITPTTAILILGGALLALASLPVTASPAGKLGTGVAGVLNATGAITSPTRSPTATQSVTPTQAVTPTASVTATATVTVTATPTATATATETPTPTLTPSATSTFTPSPTPTVTPCPELTPPPTDFRVDVQVGGNLLRGRTLPNGQVSATLTEPGAGVRATAQDRADNKGGWELQFVAADGWTPVGIRPGWRVQVNAPNGSADIRPVKLKLTIDPLQRRVYGEGPPNTRLRIVNSFSTGEQIVFTDARGEFNTRWRAHHSPQGDAWGEVFFAVAANQNVYARDRFISLIVELGSPDVVVTGPPMSHLSASVEAPGRVTLATAAGAANGWGERVFSMRHQATGQPLPVAPGMLVIGTCDRPYLTREVDVPEMTGRIAPGGGSIVGRAAMPLRPIKARLFWPPDPGDPCAIAYVDRPAAVGKTGSFVIPLEPPVLGPLPRPLDDVDQIVLSLTMPNLEEVRLKISTEYGPLVASVYLPSTLQRPRTDRWPGP